MPKPYQTATPRSWTRNADPEAERFAGTAVFRAGFETPPGRGPWLLDLGTVCHSARARLNGEEIGLNLNYKPFDASAWPVMDSGLLGPVVLHRAAESR